MSKSNPLPDSDRLLFRRQFLLGPDCPTGLEGWHRRKITNECHLSTHPDLEVTHIVSGDNSLTLLGFILDPDNPAASNFDILRNLLCADWSSGNPATLTAGFGGRWAMVAHDRTRTILFHDATGMRQVYYCRAPIDDTRIVHCGSQPRLIAELLGFTPDPAAIEYNLTRGSDDLEVYWMPGDVSQYSEIRALLPNHQLDLRTGTTTRYWPTQKLQAMDYQQAVSEGVRLLRGLMDSARRRYPLSIAMTAGWDSRLMLALTADFAAEVHFFTLVYPGSGEGSRDVNVPSRLLQKLGMKHHLIRYPERIDTSFKDVFKRNSSAIQNAYCADAQAMYDIYPPDRLCVTGDVAEIVKNYYGTFNAGSTSISAPELARLCKIGDHPFGVAALQAWISDLIQPGPIGVLDLFCWEQMAGRWQAHIRAEYDIVQESFAPLNCRKLLLTLLASDEMHRTPPDFNLFRGLIETLWKEVLTIPINPPEKASWKLRIVKMLRALQIYKFIPEIAKSTARRIWRRSSYPT